MHVNTCVYTDDICDKSALDDLRQTYGYGVMTFVFVKIPIQVTHAILHNPLVVLLSHGRDGSMRILRNFSVK